MNITGLSFYKAQGLGNDFVMTVDLQTEEKDLSSLSRYLADRRYGIGCDQIIYAWRLDEKAYKVRFFNGDGSEAESCGNGTRCIAKLLMRENRCEDITLVTLGGTLYCRLDESGGHGTSDNPWIKVQMPEPQIDLNFEVHSIARLSNPDAVAVYIGNPHLVCFSESTDLAGEYGPGLECHPAFTNRTNVGFAKVISRDRLELQVWERGAGLTKACGTGACAAAVAAFTRGLCDRHVYVDQPGGQLLINTEGNTLTMSGPAKIVYTGRMA